MKSGLQKWLGIGQGLSRKTPRLFDTIEAFWGLKCVLSGNLVQFKAT